MMQFLLSERALIFCEILIIVALVAALIVRAKKNRDMRERRRISNAKMRNVYLEERLKNPDIESGWAEQPIPFDVQYVDTADHPMKEAPKFQVEIEVHTGTTVQKYLFDLDHPVTIGKDRRNVLPLSDPMVAKKHCSVFCRKGAVYAKNHSVSQPIIIQRGKKRRAIQKQVVLLQSKDILTLGKTMLYLTLHEN